MVINYFDKYYSFNRRILSIVGLWPLQNIRQRQLIFGSICLSAAFVISATINVLPSLDIATIISDSLPVYIFHLSWVIKALNNIYHNDKMFIMVTRIKEYWEDQETDHLELRHIYAKQGRLMGFIFTIYARSKETITLLQLSSIINVDLAFAVSTFYWTSAILPKIFFLLGLSNVPAEIDFPCPVTYFVDMEKYFTVLFIHGGITLMILTLLIGAIESLLFSFTMHACGMMAEVEWRLKTLINDDNLNIGLNTHHYKDDIFVTIGNIVQKHVEAIEFCKLLEASYRWAFFFIVALNAIIISTTSLQIVKTFETMLLEDILRLVTFVTGQMLHIALECYVSQNIIDRSEAIGDAVKHTKWYLMSSKAGKLLNLISIRSRKPCVMTAGSFFVMSHTFFRDVMRTSMSYFTLLRSTE